MLRSLSNVVTRTADFVRSNMSENEAHTGTVVCWAWPDVSRIQADSQRCAEPPNTLRAVHILSWGASVQFMLDTKDEVLGLEQQARALRVWTATTLDHSRCVTLACTPTMTCTRECAQM